MWRTAEQAMQHIETSLTEGLAEGRSAAELSRTIRQDLREPERLYRRVRDKNGILQLSKPARAYHPGAGVYRSSYKNALRLTRTEINVSYAEADFERWQRLDFVIGYVVRLSNNHTCNGHPFTDICDELAGKYPKWFKFTKWHPQCRCVAIPIFDDDPGAKEVRDVPPNFKQWVTDNQPRLDRSIKKGTAPYWVRDNFSKQGKLTRAGRKPATPRTAGGGNKPPKPPVATTTAPADPDEERRRRTLERAKARHQARTPEEIARTRIRWTHRETLRELDCAYKEGGMTFEEADNGLGNLLFRRGPGYSVNCQSCVVAHEMRLRGYHVTARQNTQKKGNGPFELSWHTNRAWRDPVTGKVREKIHCGGRPLYKGEDGRLYYRRRDKPKSQAVMFRELEEAGGVPGRYHLDYTHKGGGGGHIVTLTRDDKGSLSIYDPQINKRIEGTRAVRAYLIRYVSPTYGLNILRVDDLIIDPKVAKRVLYHTATDRR